MLEVTKIKFGEGVSEKDAVLETTRAMSELLINEGYKITSFFDCDDEIRKEDRKYNYVGEIRFSFDNDSSSPTIRIVRNDDVISIGLTSNNSNIFSQIHKSIKELMDKLCTTLNEKNLLCDYDFVDFGLDTVISNIKTPEQCGKETFLGILNIKSIKTIKKIGKGVSKSVRSKKA